MTGPAQHLITARRKSGENPPPSMSRIRSLAMNRERTRTKIRVLTSIRWPDQYLRWIHGFKFHRRRDGRRHRPALGCEPPPRTHCRVRPPVNSSGETNPPTRLPREPRTRTIFTGRRITPPFGSPSHRTVDPRWRRSPTEPRAVAVRGAPEIQNGK